MYDILKELRLRSGLTQMDVAEKLGVTVSTYAKIEQGKNSLNTAYIEGLADIFHSTSASILKLYNMDGNPFINLEKESYCIATYNAEINFREVFLPEEVYYEFGAPDYFQFTLPQSAAMQYIELISKVENSIKTIFNTFKSAGKLDCYYLFDDSDEDIVVFNSCIGSVLTINNYIVLGCNVTSELECITVDSVKVCCSLVLEDDVMDSSRKNLYLRLDKLYIDDFDWENSDLIVIGEDNN